MLPTLRRVLWSLNLTLPDQMVLGRRYVGDVKSLLPSCVTEGKTLDDCNDDSYRPPQLQSQSIIKILKPLLAAQPQYVLKPLLAVQPQSVLKPLLAAQPQSVLKPLFGAQPQSVLKPLFAAQPQSVLKPLLAVQTQSMAFPVRHYSDCIDDGSSSKQDPVTGMTPKMVKLLKCLSTVVKPDAQTHGVNIFKRMFQMDISIQRMFPKFACDDMCTLDRNPAFQKHVDSVMKSVLNLMDNSASVPDLKSSLAVLIKVHKELHIPPKHFITLGNALNDYLKETLGMKYSEDVECAVAYFWKYVVLEMTAQPIKIKCTKCGCTILKEC